MSWQYPALFAALLITSLLSGCGTKPWRDPLPQAGFDSAMEVVTTLQNQQRQRSNCIDSDVDIFFTSTVADRAISGYMQLLQPHSVKFVTSNPFGQPLFVFTGDGRNIQYVDTLQRYFGEGDPVQFARTFSLPQVAITGDWGNWLTARMSERMKILGIRDDMDNRGFWLETTLDQGRGNTPTGRREQLLIDPAHKRILARTILLADGSTAARLVYGTTIPETEGGPAVQPASITIDGLDYSGRLTLEFSQLRAMEGCRQADFTLRPPPGYTYQYLSGD